MQNVTVVTQGVRGKDSREPQKVSYTGVFLGGAKIMSIDNFQGQGDTFKQRHEPVIVLFGENSSDVIFEGTHQQLVDTLRKHKTMLESL